MRDAAPLRRPRVGRVWVPRFVLLGPGVLWWVVFFLVPVGLLFVYSVYRPGPFGGVQPGFTLDSYRRLFDPIFVRVLAFSVQVALITTVISLLIGYPAAYFIATAPRRWRIPLLVVVILPFWTSFLIRTYAWMVLLNPVGLIHKVLVTLGVEHPPALLYNAFAIVLGLVYAYLPLMILPIYASIERLGPQPLEAASDLYATPLQTLRKVLMPLTLPGVVAGCIFVFVPSLGNFIVPDLLGGGKKIMVGNLIQQQFLQARNWPFGAVLAVTVVLMMLLLLWGQALVLRREQRVARVR